CGEIVNTSFPDNFFDAVTMHAVLEHISEPIDALKEVHRILKEKGELIISVPNIWNWERILFGKFWWAWDIPRHLWHFSPVSLKRLLKKAGFGDISIRQKADMYDFPGNVKNMLKGIFPQQTFLNILGEQDKLRFVTKYLMMPIGVIGALLGVSEQFVIFARK
ncbi:MAG: class I SAM-dependent methyltransferase, partial [Candidatus Omnitrophica bacterium]|nr:class I SAM-dependent methyltransferase [Candidatus Omnitrophota bacterium]